MKFLSFFSGAMGLDQGLEQAGLESIFACEIDKNCRATIKANRPNLPVSDDITAVTAETVREMAGLSISDEVDLVVGGPPCQAFSTAGARKGLEDSRGNVLLRYVEMITQLKPKYAVLENVRGLLSAPLKHIPHAERESDFTPSIRETPGGVLATILSMLADAGYSVSFNLYNAANYGAPQSRERLILLCHKGSTRPLPFLLPTHSQNGDYNLPYWRTFREATNDLPSKQEHLDFPESRLRFYRLLKPGQYWKDLPVDLQKEALGASYYAGGGKTGFLRRLAWDKPSPTLVTHPAMPATDLAHPELDRPLSIDEYKRIQGFPDTWKLEGNLITRYKQLGNAVPVPLGIAIGTALLNHANGIAVLPPPDFRYSRYRNTSHLTWKNPLGRDIEYEQQTLEFAISA